MLFYKILFVIVWIVSLRIDLKLQNKEIKNQLSTEMWMSFFGLLIVGWIITLLSFVPLIIALLTEDQYVKYVVTTWGLPLFIKLIVDFAAILLFKICK